MAAPAIQSGDDDSQYRIEATGGFREPRSRILKHGDTFVVFNPFGDIAGGSGSPREPHREFVHSDPRPSRLPAATPADQPT